MRGQDRAVVAVPAARHRLDDDGQLSVHAQLSGAIYRSHARAPGVVCAAMRIPVALVLALTACGSSDEPPLPEVTDPVALVDPTIGTGGLGFAHGSCFVGAAVPHGLVKVGPDTNGPYGTVNFLH